MEHPIQRIGSIAYTRLVGNDGQHERSRGRVLNVPRGRRTSSLPTKLLRLKKQLSADPSDELKSSLPGNFPEETVVHSCQLSQ